jgi:hypothetical protein
MARNSLRRANLESGSAPLGRRACGRRERQPEEFVAGICSQQGLKTEIVRRSEVRPPVVAPENERSHRGGSVKMVSPSPGTLWQRPLAQLGRHRVWQTTGLPERPVIIPSPSHSLQTSEASALRTVRPCESWYCISCSINPSHSSRLDACPIVPDISLVSSSSNSTTNFHFVRRGFSVIPTYSINGRYKHKI